MAVRYDESTAYWVHECKAHKRSFTFARRANAEDCERGHLHFGHSQRVNQVPSEWLRRHWEMAKIAGSRR